MFGYLAVASFVEAAAFRTRRQGIVAPVFKGECANYTLQPVTQDFAFSSFPNPIRPKPQRHDKKKPKNNVSR